MASNFGQPEKPAVATQGTIEPLASPVVIVKQPADPHQSTPKPTSAPVAAVAEQNQGIAVKGSGGSRPTGTPTANQLAAGQATGQTANPATLPPVIHPDKTVNVVTAAAYADRVPIEAFLTAWADRALGAETAPHPNQVHHLTYARTRIDELADELRKGGYLK